MMDNADDQFSLKWNNFQSNLATGFHDLLQEETMVDVTLAAEGKFLQAHKIILSVCSPYFKDLFKANPCKHPIVILKDVGHQEMADMLDFMYRGEANVRQEDLAAFLKLAETLKVKGLAGDKSGDDEPPPTTQAPKRSAAPQVPKKKKVIETSVFESDDHDPGDSDYNPGGGEPRRKKRRPTPPPKTESVMPSSSSSSAQPFPLTNPKEEMPDPEEIQLIDDSDETNDPLVQLIAGQGAKQEQDQQEFDDSNFDNTLEETGDGTHETDFDITAGPSNPDESTDQIPQGLGDDNKKCLKSSEDVPLCHKCRQHYSSLANLNRHLKYECGVEARFMCPHCSQRCKRKDNLKKHMERKHGPQLFCRLEGSAEIFQNSHKKLGNSGNPIRTKRYKCFQCCKFYAEKSTLLRHLRWECGKSPSFQCSWCPHKTKFKFSLKKHIRRQHLQENTYC